MKIIEIRMYVHVIASLKKAKIHLFHRVNTYLVAPIIDREKKYIDSV